MLDYSPDLCRYLRIDPIGLKGGMNLYAYCGGDPLNRCDVWGLSFEDDDYQDSYGGWDNSGLDGKDDLDENDGREQGDNNFGSDPFTQQILENIKKQANKIVQETYNITWGVPPVELVIDWNPKTSNITPQFNLTTSPSFSINKKQTSNPNSEAPTINVGWAGVGGSVSTDLTTQQVGFGVGLPGISVPMETAGEWLIDVVTGDEEENNSSPYNDSGR